MAMERGEAAEQRYAALRRGSELTARFSTPDLHSSCRNNVWLDNDGDAAFAI
jgi:hypothetical protein